MVPKFSHLLSPSPPWLPSLPLTPPPPAMSWSGIPPWRPPTLTGRAPSTGAWIPPWRTRRGGRPGRRPRRLTSGGAGGAETGTWLDCELKSTTEAEGSREVILRNQTIFLSKKNTANCNGCPTSRSKVPKWTEYSVLNPVEAFFHKSKIRLIASITEVY